MDSMEINSYQPIHDETVTSKKVNHVHQLGPEEVLHYYEQWADGYDQDLKASGYDAPRACAEALGKVMTDKSAVIVDCAAGTGMVGEELAKLGFKRVDAVDCCQKILDISASKGVYRRLICDKFGEHKIHDIGNGYYDGLICVGALTVNEITNKAFPEWSRIVKKGGLMVFTLSRIRYDDDIKSSYRTSTLEAIDDLIRKGSWELVDKTGIAYHSGYVADMFTLIRRR